MSLIKNLKRLIIKFFKIIGYKIIKISRDRANLNRLYPIFLDKIEFPIVFDVGANKGQSIIRYKKLNKNSLIHSFEPVEEDYQFLKNKYGSDKSIFLNNFALGEKEDSRDFYINKLPGSSSFYKLTHGTEWIKQRSETHKIKPEEFYLKKNKIKVTTLDKYCELNLISSIDILKIDTQGYEDKVLQGAKNLIKDGLIKVIEVEVIFNKIYEKKMTFLDIEKNLIDHGYELLALKDPGNLLDDYIFQVDAMYFNPKILSENEREYFYEIFNKRYKN